jgi:hypothetical protein
MNIYSKYVLNKHMDANFYPIESKVVSNAAMTGLSRAGNECEVKPLIAAK